MDQQTSITTVLDPLATVAEKLREKILTQSQTVRSDIGNLVNDKRNRQSRVLGRALQPARNLLTLTPKDLPKRLWMSAVGSLFIEILEEIIAVDQDVHIQRKRLARLDSDMLLLSYLETSGCWSSYDLKPIQELGAQLDDQLLTDFRDEALSQLRLLLQDADPLVAVEREAVCSALVGFIEKHLGVAVTEAGYHIQHGLTETRSDWMLNNAENQVHDVQSHLGLWKTENGLTGSERASFTLNLDCATSLALLSFPQFAHTRANCLDGSTIAGRVSFLKACVDALEPVAQSTEQGLVAQRLKNARSRVKQELNKRGDQFDDDRRRSSRDVGRAVHAIAQAARTKRELAGLPSRCTLMTNQEGSNV